ncbi:Uncharacterized protein PCOAH_00038240 [Plasmodium coatneyi]|uniref:Uncharacterized protein n=1 Tax=Plasmodium coatneyi TaxID=208452 RepID=A0A1B1E4B1_9APIC|nr:Uncharacterized protein PCOAH_00038240 [Plasmodium coatneyi]ANQ09835.1 Uncharacterized protein PCOAH_00038240 [Plasmodium coatneyi]
MKKYLVLLCFLIFSAGRLSVKAVGKKDLRRSLKGGNRNNEDHQKRKNLLNFEIMRDKSSVSNIELNSSTLFNILASTRLMQNTGGAPPPPVYRYVHNIHDHNENNGAVLVFVLFGILIFAVLFFIFYFIFRHHVKHIKFMNSM